MKDEKRIFLNARDLPCETPFRLMTMVAICMIGVWEFLLQQAAKVMNLMLVDGDNQDTGFGFNRRLASRKRLAMKVSHLLCCQASLPST
jgi:hypothetical protein